MMLKYNYKLTVFFIIAVIIIVVVIIFSNDIIPQYSGTFNAS